MTERNLITNGRFLQNLSGWDDYANASYAAGDGDDHYGVAVLETGGGYIAHTFGVPRVRKYSLHLAVKAVGAALSTNKAQLVISDDAGNVVLTQNLTGEADTWTDNDFTVGLATGTTYTLKIINNAAAGDVKIDDVWIWYVPLSRSEIASRVAAKLGRLATERSLTTAASGSLTEGSYTYAIDAGLRFAGAVNPETGLPDARYLDDGTVQNAMDFIEKQMIEQLQRDYAVETDIHVGQRSESRSQIAKVLMDMGNEQQGGGGGPVVMRKLTHRN